MWRCASLAFVLAQGAQAFAEPPPPPAPIHVVTETRYGETLPDPYRWIERMPPEFVAWVRAEDAATRASFAAMPGYAGLLAQERHAYASEVQPSSLQRVGGLLYYQRRGAAEAQPSLFSRPRSGGPEQRLVDPVALAGPTANITFYAPSPDNRHLAYGLAQGGSEEASLHFVDLQTGKALPETDTFAFALRAAGDPGFRPSR